MPQDFAKPHHTSRPSPSSRKEIRTQVRAFARNPDRARKILPGVDIVQGDLEDPATLAAAVQDDAGLGAVSREQVAEVLIRSLLTDTAVGKTFELYATAGQAASDWDGLFSTAVPDAAGALGGARDTDNLPLDKEPVLVREDAVRLRAAK